ncbi:MAG: DUF1631 family protein [Burkholderiaceae bacterium]
MPSSSDRGPGSASAAPHALRAAAADGAARALASSPLARSPGAPDAHALRALRPVAELEAEAVAFAHGIGLVPYARATRTRFFDEVRARLHASGGSHAQLAVVDLVAAMFDYEIDDQTLPEAARPLIWRLQQPVLVLALIDPGYLGEQGRSLRVLIENLGAIAEDFGGQWQRGGELHQRLETVVRALEIVSANLYERLRVLASQVEREQARAGDGVRRLVQRMARQRKALESTPAQRNRRDYSRRPGREQERAVTEQISSRLERKTHQRLLPDTVVGFLDTVWSRVLRTTALRDGQDSPAFEDALTVVDELLDTVDGDLRSGRRGPLAARIPGLIERLHSGMRQIGVSPDAHRDFFDELFLLHLRRLHRGDDAVSRGARSEMPAPAAGELQGATYYDVDALPVLEERIASLAQRAQASAVERAVPAATEPRRPQPPRRPRASAPARLPGGERRSRDTGERSVAEASAESGASRATADTAGQAGPDKKHPSVQTAPGGASADRLLALIETADLDDLPQPLSVSEARASQQFTQLRPGQWLEYRPRGTRAMRLKVLWINEKRTVAMLVRAPDRRAVSRPMAEIADLFRRGRLRRLVAVGADVGREPDLSHG